MLTRMLNSVTSRYIIASPDSLNLISEGSGMSAANPMPPANVPHTVSRGEMEAELRHLLHCGLLREGTQLYTLTKYLGEKALDPPEFLKEYTIGVEALGKPADHDPRIDPTVRVEISKLRKRLREFYQGPGASRAVHMEIPHGSYLPVFRQAVRGEMTTTGAQPLRKLIWIAAGFVLLASVLLIGAWRRASPSLPAGLEAFWQPHLNGKRATLLVCGTPMFLKIKGGYYRDTNANRPEEIADSKRAQAVIEALKPEPDQIRPVHTFVGMGEAHGIFEITKLLASHGATLILRQSNEVSWEDFKDKHVIFLGGKKYNPQIPLLPYKQAFTAVNRRILNLSPRNGEPEEYQTSSVTPYGELTGEYALISVYPGLTPGTRLMTLDCSSTEGTLAAAEFLTREDMVSQLVGKGVPLDVTGSQAKAFQVVIHAKYNKGVVVGLAYVTHRVMESAASAQTTPRRDSGRRKAAG